MSALEVVCVALLGSAASTSLAGLAIAALTYPGAAWPLLLAGVILFALSLVALLVSERQAITRAAAHRPTTKD